MNGSTDRPRAVVCAAVGDYPTAFAAQASWTVERLLADRFEVITSAHGEDNERFRLLPIGANDIDAFAVVMNSCGAHRDPLPLAYVSAHGGEKTLSVTMNRDHAFFELEMGRVFRDAVLVLNCCLREKGALARALCRPPYNVRAVIGYENTLQVPSPEMHSRWGGTAAWDLVTAAFADALCCPVRALIEGQTVREAWERTRKCWYGFPQMAISDPDLARYIRMASCTNYHTIRVYGDALATLGLEPPPA